MSPHFFNSAYCRREVERFLDRERRSGRRSLIIPVYYITTPLIEDGARSPDELARKLNERQYTDLRELRSMTIKSRKILRTISQIADDICHQVGRVEPAVPRVASPVTALEQGTWESLAYILSATAFDGASWTALSASAASLLDELTLKRPVRSDMDNECEALLRDLQATLHAVLRPNAGTTELRAACRKAERIQRWLLDLLPNPWH
ncbi:hypothetical protein [Nonomuraea basaltis]|uniref:hypothetical protein n=1 Tax=Nonomuraea basaltis TaxID=2495887 RepID=UPI00110C630C|nr:hypothetical protein [Nonomuraea basaltis]TMR96124.1 hypothetical protein EJK15_25270 [Nonomuraea basaltis]